MEVELFLKQYQESKGIYKWDYSLKVGSEIIDIATFMRDERFLPRNSNHPQVEQELVKIYEKEGCQDVHDIRSRIGDYFVQGHGNLIDKLVRKPHDSFGKMHNVWDLKLVSLSMNNCFALGDDVKFPQVTFSRADYDIMFPYLIPGKEPIYDVDG